MPTDFHTPHPFGAAVTAAEFNARLGELDAAIGAAIAAGFVDAATTLDAQAASGQKVLPVASTVGFIVGDSVWVGTVGSGLQETGVIASISAGVSLTLVANLASTHAIGEPVSRSPAEIVNARSTFATLGQRLDVLGVDVRGYGGSGDDSTYNDTAIANALAAADGADVYFPPGTYRIQEPIPPANYVRLRGASRTLSLIKQMDSNVPILQWGGYGSLLTDLGLIYGTAQGDANTGAVGIELYAPSWSTMDRVSVARANVGMGIKAAGTSVGGGGGTANYVASCTFRDLIVQGFSVTGISQVPYNGGSSGSVYDNIYILGRDEAGAAMDIVTGLTIAGSEGVFNQLNIESGNPDNAIYAYNCDALTFNSIHLEQLTPKSNYNAFLDFDAGNYIVNGLLLAYNHILVGNIANEYAIFRVHNNTRVMVDGPVERNSTVTTPIFSEWIVSGSTGTELYVRGVETSGVTREGYFADPTIRKQRNGAVSSLL